MAQDKLWPKIPKTGEFWTLKSGIGEADLQITNVSTAYTSGGWVNGTVVTIEGVPIRQRMGEQNTNPGMDSYSFPAFSTTPNIKMSTGSIKFTMDDHKSKGMVVEIKTIETVDGTKAQIVLNVGTKSVIAWETKAFEDDKDLEKGLTAQVKAKNNAEAHAKGVLKSVFNTPTAANESPF